MTISELSDDAILELSDLLKLKRSELLHQLDDSSSDSKPVQLDQQSVGRVSRIDAIQQQQMAIANRGQLQHLLKEIEEALNRIEIGEYGLCLNCAEMIKPGRLQIQPSAQYCLTCQSEFEA